jgi:secreted trypsin-like serine protease
MRENIDGEPMPYWYLAGVVSFGPRECGTEGMPGVYTRVASYLEWMNEEIY